MSVNLGWSNWNYLVYYPVNVESDWNRLFYPRIIPEETRTKVLLGCNLIICIIIYRVNMAAESVDMTPQIHGHHEFS